LLASNASVLIRLGYDIELGIAQAMTVIAVLKVHPSRISDLREPDEIRMAPDAARVEYTDSFGNLSHHHRLPKLRLQERRCVEGRTRVLDDRHRCEGLRNRIANARGIQFTRRSPSRPGNVDGNERQDISVCRGRLPGKGDVRDRPTLPRSRRLQASYELNGQPGRFIVSVRFLARRVQKSGEFFAGLKDRGLLRGNQ
jgi:hypothetical protein